MAQPFSDATRLKAGQALRQWRLWQTSARLKQEPVVIEVLGGGRSNTSLLVAAERHRFVLRIDGIDPRSLGINRQAEYRAQYAAWEQGLAPRPCYHNPDLGVFVSEFCDTEKPPERLQEIAGVAQALHRIHQLPARHSRMRPLERAHRYIAAAGSNARCSPDFEAACERSHRLCREARLCHNDLLSPNRLWQRGAVVALDWEYAAMGDPLFDLAVICEGDCLSMAESRHLLRAYLDLAGPTDAAQQRLDDNRLIYRELDTLWQQATGL